MIQVNHVSKTFGSECVLDDVSVEIQTGRVNMIIGRSGSGKSVLTKCVVGLIQPEEGQVLFDGREFLKMGHRERREIRKEIGMLFQGGALFDSLTVEENVMFPLRMFQRESKEKMLERVNFCLDRVRLEDVNELYPAELSGGMKKRVAIARAISLNPKYLFCDEPNSGLDPQTSIIIDELIREITYDHGITTIVVTHDMSSVTEVGDIINFLHNGKKWWEGYREDVFHSENKELNDFVFASNIMKEVRDKH